MRLQRLLLVGTLALAASSPVVLAKSAEDLRLTFASFRTAEFPREVGKLIAKEKGTDRADRATDIVRQAVIYSPAAAFATVGAACRVAPDLAVQFAVAAANVQSQLAPGIARAAAAAAPAHAAEIAAAVAKERPAQFALIAYEVAYAVPGQDQKIAEAVIASVPNLKTFAAATVNSNVSLIAVPDQAAVGPSTPVPVSVSRSITDLVAVAPLVESTARELGMKTEQLLVASLTPAQTATVNTKVQTAKVSATASSNAAVKGVPFVPGGGTPGEANRAQTVVVTPGSGRDYKGNNGNNGNNGNSNGNNGNNGNK